MKKKLVVTRENKLPKFYMILSHGAVAEAAGISEEKLFLMMHEGSIPRPVFTSLEGHGYFGIESIAEWLGISQHELFDLLCEDDDEPDAESEDE
jgi:hypothetical protein